MRNTLKTIAVVALLAVVTVACGKVEKILPSKDGLWKSTSWHTLSYLNDSLIADLTQTDSLPSFFFAEDGTGYTQFFGFPTTDPFTWSVNEANDQLTIVPADTSSSASVIDILESSRKEMTWYLEETSGSGSNSQRFKTTMEVARAE